MGQTLEQPRQEEVYIRQVCRQWQAVLRHVASEFNEGLWRSLGDYLTNQVREHRAGRHSHGFGEPAPRSAFYFCVRCEGRQERDDPAHGTSDEFLGDLRGRVDELPAYRPILQHQGMPGPRCKHDANRALWIAHTGVAELAATLGIADIPAPRIPDDYYSAAASALIERGTAALSPAQREGETAYPYLAVGHAIHVECPSCQSWSSAAREKAGKSVACRKCGEPLRVEGPSLPQLHIRTHCPSCKFHPRLRAELIGTRVSCPNCRKPMYIARHRIAARIRADSYVPPLPKPGVDRGDRAEAPVAGGRPAEVRELRTKLAQERPKTEELGRQLEERAEQQKQFEGLEARSAEKDGRIAELTTELRETRDEHDRQVAEVKRQVAENDRRAAEQRKRGDRLSADLVEAVAQHATHVAELEAVVAEKDRAAAELTEGARRLQASLDEAARSVHRAEVRIEQLRTRLDLLELGIADRDGRLHEQRGQLALLAAEVAVRDARIVELEGRAEELAADVSDRDERIAALHAESSRLRDDLPGQIDLLDTRLQEADAQRESMLAEHQRRLNEHESETRVLTERIEERERTHAAYVGETDEQINQLRSSLAEETRLAEEAMEQIEALTAERRQRDDRIGEYQSQIAQLLRDVADRDARLADIEGQLREVGTDRDSLANELRGRIEEYAAVQSLNRDLEEAKEARQRRIAELTHWAEQVEGSLADQTRSADEAAKRVAALESHLEHRDSRIEELEHRLEIAKTSVNERLLRSEALASRQRASIAQLNEQLAEAADRERRRVGSPAEQLTRVREEIELHSAADEQVRPAEEPPAPAVDVHAERDEPAALPPDATRFCAKIADVPLLARNLPASVIKQGRPNVSGRIMSVSRDGRTARVVWRSTPGVLEMPANRNVVDVGYVVSGRGAIRLRNGADIPLAPGVVIEIPQTAYELEIAATLTKISVVHARRGPGFHPEPV